MAPDLNRALARAEAKLRALGPMRTRGLAPLPAPTQEDKAAATRAIDEHLAGLCPIYAANNRDELIRSRSFSERNARLRQEWRERGASVASTTHQRKAA